MPNFKVTYFCNIMPSKFLLGYAEGALLMDAGTAEFEADDVHHACELAFMFWNRDDRPNGRTAPSMSTGDVARVDDGDVITDWAAERIGFRPIDDAKIFANRDGLPIPDAMRLVSEISLKLIETAESLDEDIDVDAIAAEGRANPLPEEDAKRLYGRIIGILNPKATEDDVAAQVEEILDTQRMEGRRPT